jgi:hypothetical protein
MDHDGDWPFTPRRPPGNPWAGVVLSIAILVCSTACCLGALWINHR